MPARSLHKQSEVPVEEEPRGTTPMPDQPFQVAKGTPCGSRIADDTTRTSDDNLGSLPPPSQRTVGRHHHVQRSKSLTSADSIRFAANTASCWLMDWELVEAPKANTFMVNRSS